MYYSIVLACGNNPQEEQRAMFAINAENTMVDSDMFTHLLKDVSKYRNIIPLLPSKAKCKKYAREWQTRCTFFNSIEELIVAVNKHRFYRYEKTYDIILTEKVYKYDFSKWGICCGETFFGGQDVNVDTSLRHLFFNVYNDDCPFLLDKIKIAKILGEAFDLQVCVAKGTGDWLYIRSVDTNSYIQSVDGVWELHLFTEIKVESGEIKVEI